jgi:hypothetical protein
MTKSSAKPKSRRRKPRKPGSAVPNLHEAAYQSAGRWLGHLVTRASLPFDALRLAFSGADQALGSRLRLSALARPFTPTTATPTTAASAC